MHYRLSDATTQRYLANGYNETDQTEFKKAINDVLLEGLDQESIDDMSKLKWDMYKKELKKVCDLAVEEDDVPFNLSDVDEGDTRSGGGFWGDVGFWEEDRGDFFDGDEPEDWD